MKTASKNLVISACSLVLLSACGKSADAQYEAAPLEPEGWADASAEFINPAGETVGEILFKDAPRGGVLMRIDLTGLTPGWHGAHLHQVGDCSDGADGFKASGGHVNPHGSQHGLLNPEGPELADLPNLHAGGDGVATAEIFAAGLSLTVGAEGPVQHGLYNLQDDDGFAVVVHANADDHMTQPIGGAGARVACAAIN